MLSCGMHPEQDTPIPPPTYGTQPGVASVNSVYSYGRDCGDEDTDPLAAKGETLDGTMGWDQENTDG